MIRISKLIKDLQEFEKKNGNVPVVMEEEGMGGEAILLFSHISTEEIYPEMLDEVGEGDEGIKSLFPEWNGEVDELYEGGLKPAKCVKIAAGSMIYST